MAEKVIRLNPRIPFFLEGLHLANPEKPYVILPENFVPSAKIVQAIKRGVLLDVNKNILVDEKAEAIKAKTVKQDAPKEEAKEVVEETPVEVVTEEATEEVVETEKPKAKTKKTTAKK